MRCGPRWERWFIPALPWCFYWQAWPQKHRSYGSARPRAGILPGSPGWGWIRRVVFMLRPKMMTNAWARWKRPCAGVWPAWPNAGYCPASPPASWRWRPNRGGVSGFCSATRRLSRPDSTAFATRWMVSPAPGGQHRAELLYAKGDQPRVYRFGMKEGHHGTAPPTLTPLRWAG